MTVLRRSRRKQEAAAAAPKGQRTQDTNRSDDGSQELPAHVERSLIAMTAKMQQCIERLDIIDERLDELDETTMNTPSHADVMEVRMHSAKLAAELARSTVELRGEIGMASDEARRAARITRTLVDETPVALPVDIELPENESGEDHKGWSASA